MSTRAWNPGRTLVVATAIAALPAVARAGEADEIPVVDAARIMGTMTAEAAAAAGLTVLDLRDDWLPAVFSETPEAPQPLRPRLVALANERFGRGPAEARAREDAHFELYGIAPSLAVIRRRFADEPRHACHDLVMDGALASFEGRRPGPAAVRALQAHLGCERLLDRRARAGRLDRFTVSALATYQRLHRLLDHGRLDVETRATLITDSRELDYRALLRVLRERVADAAGIIEDGSASATAADVLERTLDGAELRAGLALAGAIPRGAAAPDRLAEATEVAARALGWTSPEVLVAASVTGPPWPERVALRLPAPPPYEGPMMDLRAEIDRGEVSLAPPTIDDEGRPRARRPSRRRPTLTLYARSGDHEVALVRWPTTIGGWKEYERRDGSKALKYKESRTGPAIWRDLLAGPTWHPPPGMPARKLVERRRGRWQVKRDVIGPGYHAAYGLVALVHHQVVPPAAPTEESALVDYLDPDARVALGPVDHARREQRLPPPLQPPGDPSGRLPAAPPALRAARGGEGGVRAAPRVGRGGGGAHERSARLPLRADPAGARGGAHRRRARVAADAPHSAGRRAHGAGPAGAGAGGAAAAVILRPFSSGVHRRSATMLAAAIEENPCCTTARVSCSRSRSACPLLPGRRRRAARPTRTPAPSP